MLWVGLTGGIASGKSTVSDLLRKQGFEVVSADQLAHHAMAKGSVGAEAIRKTFGGGVFHSDGSVDRSKLGEVVFGDTSGRLRKQLEAILHPVVRVLADRERLKLAERGDAMAFYEVPLLFENDLDKAFDKIICVVVSPEVQLERLIKRSGLSIAAAKNRVAAQLLQDEKAKRADYVIDNGKDFAALSRAVENVVSELRKK